MQMQVNMGVCVYLLVESADIVVRLCGFLVDFHGLYARIELIGELVEHL